MYYPRFGGIFRLQVFTFGFMEENDLDSDVQALIRMLLGKFECQREITVESTREANSPIRMHHYSIRILDTYSKNTFG